MGTQAQSRTLEFTPNTAEKERSESLIVQHFGDSSRTVIAYSKHGYWSADRTYFLLIQEDRQWELLRWTVTYKDRAKEKIKRTRKKRFELAPGSVDSLLAFWNKEGFWGLPDDSLNVRTIQVNDSVQRMISISDGASDTFEVWDHGIYGEWSAYMADWYQREIPVRSREVFIRCRQAFLRALEEDPDRTQH